MDLSGPEIDMVGLAQSLGVYAERVGEPDVLAEKVRESLATNDRPRLFDVPIERTLAGPG
jgi:thiamine pyrophosphate-dependent acetolactate synthase large subunit-like protein